MIKKINIIIVGVIASLFAMSCNNDAIVYDGPAAIGFATTATNFIVKNADNQKITINFGTANSTSKDITIPLIITANNGAVNGTQFVCPTSVTIPAGKTAASFDITSAYDALTAGVIYSITIEMDPSASAAFIIGSEAIKVAMSRQLTLGEFAGTYTTADAKYGGGTIATTLYMTEGIKDTLWLQNIGALSGVSTQVPTAIVVNLENLTFRLLIGDPITIVNLNVGGVSTPCYVVPEAYAQPYDELTGTIDLATHTFKIAAKSPVTWWFYAYNVSTGGAVGYLTAILSSSWKQQ